MSVIYINDELHIVEDLDGMMSLVERYMGSEAASLLAEYIDDYIYTERGNNE